MRPPRCWPRTTSASRACRRVVRRDLRAAGAARRARATAPGCRRCSTSSARWRRPRPSSALIPAAAAEAIAAACRAELFDAGRIAPRAAGRAIRPSRSCARCAPPWAAMRPGTCTHGATSQDIVDTAAMLVATRALELVLADVAAVTAACAELADAHRATPMVARTLLQHAAADHVRPQGGDVARRRARGAAARRSTRATGWQSSSAARPARSPPSASDGPDVVAAGRGRPRPGRAGAALAHLARARGRARIGARDARRRARQDRARRGADGPDRGRRGARAGRRGPRRILDHAAQAEPGRLDPHARLRPPGAGRRRPADGQPRAGARTRGGRVAGRVGRHLRRARGGRRRGREHGRGAHRPARSIARGWTPTSRHARADPLGAPRLRARRAHRPGGREARSSAQRERAPRERGTTLREELAADRRDAAERRRARRCVRPRDVRGRGRCVHRPRPGSVPRAAVPPEVRRDDAQVHEPAGRDARR